MTLNLECNKKDCPGNWFLWLPAASSSVIIFRYLNIDWDLKNRFLIQAEKLGVMAATLLILTHLSLFLSKQNKLIIYTGIALHATKYYKMLVSSHNLFTVHTSLLKYISPGRRITAVSIPLSSDFMSSMNWPTVDNSGFNVNEHFSCFDGNVRVITGNPCLYTIDTLSAIPQG